MGALALLGPDTQGTIAGAAGSAPSVTRQSSLFDQLTGAGGGAPGAGARGGRAFCFLPLPVPTGLPVHVNGYFELSANRRDIWWGSDMTGEGRLRSEWNKLLLEEVIAPCYAQVRHSACLVFLFNDVDLTLFS